ncbi:MAG TPA: FHA domain-containing protein [Thermosynergistes sp.]|nr:FHA domain-containing protein [Thermosynergistes sp.]
MSWVRCDKGHYYDDERHSSCPYCGVEEVSVDVSTFRSGEDIKASAANSQGERGDENEKTVRLGEFKTMGGSEEGETVALVRSNLGMDPVTGWLVCIDGPEKGRDFRIRSERNSIGRAPTNDICLRSDETVSRIHHAYVIYDPKKAAFRLQAGEGRGLVYKNGEEVVFSEPLEAYDVIELGQTKLLFVPLCWERFKWE